MQNAASFQALRLSRFLVPQLSKGKLALRTRRQQEKSEGMNDAIHTHALLTAVMRRLKTEKQSLLTFHLK